VGLRALAKGAILALRWLLVSGFVVVVALVLVEIVVVPHHGCDSRFANGSAGSAPEREAHGRAILRAAAAEYFNCGLPS
jgi:hypothetical protein